MAQSFNMHGFIPGNPIRKTRHPWTDCPVRHQVSFDPTLSASVATKCKNKGNKRRENQNKGQAARKLGSVRAKNIRAKNTQRGLHAPRLKICLQGEPLTLGRRKASALQPSLAFAYKASTKHWLPYLSTCWLKRPCLSLSRPVFGGIIRVGHRGVV